MSNPMIHLIAFMAAVVIPGGLLVYFAWRTTRAISPKAKPKENDLRAKLERTKKRADKRRAQKNS